MHVEVSNAYTIHLLTDFRRRFISLLSYQFKSYLPSMALSLLQVPKTVPESGESKSATASKS